ncbi:Uncharacterised protein [Legionella bozemanae]|nr:Uncharacterised protein [Legionella bozemanae]
MLDELIPHSLKVPADIILPHVPLDYKTVQNLI